MRCVFFVVNFWNFFFRWIQSNCIVFSLLLSRSFVYVWTSEYVLKSHKQYHFIDNSINEMQKRAGSLINRCPNVKIDISESRSVLDLHARQKNANPNGKTWLTHGRAQPITKYNFICVCDSFCFGISKRARYQF